MAELRFTCATCGEEHEGLPDLGFAAPMYSSELPEEERRGRAVLTDDTCELGGEHFFVRACLPIPIRGTGESFVWGVWVSLSEKNFRRYLEHFEGDPPEGEGPYFGWLSNQLPGYAETTRLATRVVLQKDRQRPRIELEPTDHPLAVHQREGIPLPELLELLGDAVHPP